MMLKGSRKKFFLKKLEKKSEKNEATKLEGGGTALVAVPLKNFFLWLFEVKFPGKVIILAKQGFLGFPMQL